MGDSRKGQVRVTGGFSPGTKVGLSERYGDFAPKNHALVDKGKVDSEGTVTFTGLPEGQRYWVVSLEDDDHRVLAATAKPEAKRDPKLSDSEVRNRLSQTIGARRNIQGNVVADPDTKTKTVVVAPGGLELQGNTGQPTAKEDREQEPQPRLRQEDARNVPQRSATVTGSAHPVEAGEPQPLPRQEDFKDVPQRSATETGSATPILPKPETQEDARRLHQRSATELGVAEPKPAGDPIHQALTRDASVKQAQADQPEAPNKASEQRKRTPAPSNVKKATAKASETQQAAKKDAAVRKQVRKSADKQSDN